MTMDDRIIVRKEARGALEMHPSDPAAIVKYRVIVTVLRSDGSQAARKSKDATKIISFINLADATDLRRVARDAISKCDCLSSDRVDDLEQILAAIRNRLKQTPLVRPGTATRPFTATPLRRSKDEAKLSDLQQYRNRLYNTLEDKIEGTEMILLLCQKTENLGPVLRSDPVISALARLLFEDESRNLDLKINVTRTFAALSQLSTSASYFAKHRIGATLVHEMQTELTRSDELRDEVNYRKSVPRSDPSEYEAFRKKVIQVMRQQDLFFLAAVQILSALGQDLSTQIKMVKRDIIPFLTRCCERGNADLQLSALRFLLATSLYVENIDSFVQCGTTEAVIRALDQQRSVEVSNLAMKLLYNLSLCPTLRKTMFKRHLPRRLIVFFGKQETIGCAAQVLYSLSSDKKLLRDLDIPELMAALAAILNGNDLSDISEYLLCALLNILKNPEAAADFGPRINLMNLCDISVVTRNSLLLKLVASCFSGAASTNELKKSLLKLMGVIREKDATPFQLTCFLALSGAVANGLIEPEELHKLGKLDGEIIVKGRSLTAPAELVALVVFIGALASFDFSAKLLADISIPDWLCTKLADVESEEKELALQIGYALLKFTQYEPARLRLMDYPDITKILSTRAREASVVGKALFEELLLRLSLASEDIHEAWKMERFQQYNGQWLQALTNRREDDDIYEDDFNDGEEMDLVMKYGLDDLEEDELDDNGDMEEMIEQRYSRTQSRLGHRVE